MPRPRPPLLMLDVDGVISLFGFSGGQVPSGRFHSIDGIPHYLSDDAARHLRRLHGVYEMVWASGWEDRANDHLPYLLGLPGPLPYLRFDSASRAGRSLRAHWKLDAVDAHAGRRPLAWVDDAFNDACERWAAARPAPTLLVPTSPAAGLGEREAQLLLSWARAQG